MDVTVGSNAFRTSATPTSASAWITTAPRNFSETRPRPRSISFRSTSKAQTQVAASGSRPRGFGTVEEEKGKPSKRKGGTDSGGGNSEDDDAIPPAVFDRMMRRILWFVGTPMATGVVLLWVMESLKGAGLWDVPTWLPFASTLVFFGTSAVGIAYGTLSSSWDPDRVGSLLGWEEAQRNWPELWQDEEEDASRRG